MISHLKSSCRQCVNCFTNHGRVIQWGVWIICGRKNTYVTQSRVRLDSDPACLRQLGDINRCLAGRSRPITVVTLDDK